MQTYNTRVCLVAYGVRRLLLHFLDIGLLLQFFGGTICVILILIKFPASVRNLFRRKREEVATIAEEEDGKVEDVIQDGANTGNQIYRQTESDVQIMGSEVGKLTYTYENSKKKKTN